MKGRSAEEEDDTDSARELDDDEESVSMPDDESGRKNADEEAEEVEEESGREETSCTDARMSKQPHRRGHRLPPSRGKSIDGRVISRLLTEGCAVHAALTLSHRTSQAQVPNSCKNIVYPFPEWVNLDVAQRVRKSTVSTVLDGL